jgi:hypothetical protein
MPQLTESRHESFAIHRAGGASLTEAAKRAGFKTGTANYGSRLVRRPEIAARISEIQTEANTVHLDGKEDVSGKFIAKAFVITETISIHELAKRENQYAVSLNCLRLLAQLGGHLSDGTGRNSSNAPNLTQVNIHTMTAKALGEYLRGQVQSLPAADRKGLENVIDVEVVSSDESIDDLL